MEGVRQMTREEADSRLKALCAKRFGSDIEARVALDEFLDMVYAGGFRGKFKNLKARNCRVVKVDTH